MTSPITQTQTTTRTGAYGHTQTIVLVNDYLIVEGYGGEDTLNGGRYSRGYGYALRVMPGDTLDSLLALDDAGESIASRAYALGRDGEGRSVVAHVPPSVMRDYRKSI